MKSFKKIIGLVMAVIMSVTCTGLTAFAAEVPENNGIVENATFTELPEGAKLVGSSLTAVPGIMVGSGTSQTLYYSVTASATVQSGHTAHYVGIIMADRTTGSTATGTFTVSPAFPDVSTFTGSSQVQYFTLAGNGLGSGQTGSWTFTADTAPWDHLYQVAVMLYE